jgi:hypothetical protein
VRQFEIRPSLSTDGYEPSLNQTAITMYCSIRPVQLHVDLDSRKVVVDLIDKVHATTLESVIFSRPDAYPSRGLIYTSHLRDLLITLLDVLLIYAYCIDLKHPRLVFQTEVS